MHWLPHLEFAELKRSIYFWCLIVGTLWLGFVFVVKPDDPYVQYIHPFLALLFVYWCYRLSRMAPIEQIEQQVAIGMSINFYIKLNYYLYLPDMKGNWLEIEDAYWNLAFQMIIFYIIYDSKRGLFMALGVTAFTILAGVFRFGPTLLSGQSEAMFSSFVREEIRLFCMAFLLYIMARFKDNLVQMKHQVEQSELLARTDGLTGVANRMAINEILEAELRQPDGLYLILLDIDHFKRINDQFGHSEGDLVLQLVAARLSSRLRKGDQLGRWGGEEFVLLMRAKHPEDVIKTVERLREGIAHEPFSNVGTVTSSFGIAPAFPGDTLRTVVQRADTALYRAKHLGRNRVEMETGHAELPGQEASSTIKNLNK